MKQCELEASTSKFVTNTCIVSRSKPAVIQIQQSLRSSSLAPTCKPSVICRDVNNHSYNNQSDKRDAIYL